jgi:hypothetical protein
VVPDLKNALRLTTIHIVILMQTWKLSIDILNIFYLAVPLEDLKKPTPLRNRKSARIIRRSWRLADVVFCPL